MNVNITNVPNKLITERHYEKTDTTKCNIRFKYAPSVGGNGYGMLQVPSDTVEEMSPKFSKVTLDSNTKYPIYYTNEDDQKRTHWAYGSEVKELFDKSRAPKQPGGGAPPAPAAHEREQAPVANAPAAFNEYDDIAF